MIATKQLLSLSLSRSRWLGSEPKKIQRANPPSWYMYTILLLDTHAILVGALGASWCEITDVCPPACKRLSLLACAQYSYSLYIYPRARKGISIEEEDSCCFEKLDVSRPFAVIPPHPSLRV